MTTVTKDTAGKSASGDKMISFPRLESWNTLTNVATIAAKVDNKRVLCRIAQKDLRDKFGTSEEEPMQLLVNNRTVIQEAAQKLIENEEYEADGSVLIRACDL